METLRMQFDFSGQTVLITGATRGLGAQMAKDFGQLGANLILTGTHPKQINNQPQYYSVNFSDHNSTENFLKEIGQIKKIDVLINNAGINKIDFLEVTNPQDWDRIMNVNLKAPYLLTREVVPLMKKNRYGRIVNIGSIFGSVSRLKRSIYTASKYGLRGLTVTSSIELAQDNILVNTVSPGFVDTDLTRQILSDEERKSLAESVPLKRFAKSDEISRVVIFLASNLNTYLTGQNIIVDGGYVCV